ALRLIPEEGDAALTVRRVAAEAQIPPTSLRDQFSSQNAVREAMMRAVAHRLRQRIDALPAELTGAQWDRAALLELLPQVSNSVKKRLHSIIDGLTRQMLLQADERSTAWGATAFDRMLPSGVHRAPDGSAGH